MTIAHVRDNGSFVRSSGSGTTWTVTLTSGYSAGDLATLAFHISSSSVAVSGITDTLGNSYVQVGFALNGSVRAALWVCTNTAAGTPTLTITFSGTNPAAELSVSEWSGLGTTVDVTATNTGSGTSWASGTTAATTSAAELVLAVFGVFFGAASNPTITPGSGYTNLPGVLDGVTSHMVQPQYKITAATGTQSDTTTSNTSASSYAALIATFPAVSGTPTSIGAPTMAGTSTLSVTLLKGLAPIGAVALSGASTMTANVTSDPNLLGTVTMAGASTLAIGVFGQVTPLGAVTLAGLSTMTVTLVGLQTLGLVVLAGTSAMTATIGHAGQITSFTDYCVASGATYLYRARGVTAAGATADSDTTPAGVVISEGIWLHTLANPAGTIHRFLWDIGPKSDRYTPAVALVQVQGRTYPLAEFDETMSTGQVVAGINCYFDPDVSPPYSSDRAALDTIVYARGAVCYRDHRGRKAFGAIADYQVTDLNLAYQVQLTLSRTADSEVV